MATAKRKQGQTVVLEVPKDFSLSRVRYLLRNANKEIDSPTNKILGLTPSIKTLIKSLRIRSYK
jgi:hypothetical protein